MKRNRNFALQSILLTCYLSFSLIVFAGVCPEYQPDALRNDISTLDRYQCMQWQRLKQQCVCDKQCKAFYDIEEEYKKLCL